METLKLTIGIVIFYFVVSCAFELEEECSASKRRKCRASLFDQLDNQKRALSTHELEFHCRSLREHLECMVWQLSECTKSTSDTGDSELIWRAWKYMKIVCETFGAWWQHDCFMGKDTKACEKHILVGDIKNKRSTCTDYDLFHDCIVDVMEAKCSDDESGHFGSYLLDRAGSLIWNCPRVENHKKKHVEFDDKQAVDGSSVSIITSDGGKDVSIASTNNKQLVAQDSRLHSSFRSSPLLGDSPFVTGCNARATEEMRGCLDRHQYERDQALGAKESEERLKKTCCATWNYRRCVQNAVRIHCYDTREIDIQEASDVIPHDRDFLCREHWIYQCDGASSAIPNIMSMLAMAIIMYIRSRTLN